MELDGRPYWFALVPNDARPCMDAFGAGSIIIPQGSRMELRFAAFVDDETLRDITNVESAKLVIRQDNAAGKLLVTKTVANDDMDAALTLEEWRARDGQHFTIVLEAEETGWPIVAKWRGELWWELALTTTGGQQLARWGKGICQRSGISTAGESEVTGDDYYNRVQSDARFAQESTVTASLALKQNIADDVPAQKVVPESLSDEVLDFLAGPLDPTKYLGRITAADQAITAAATAGAGANYQVDTGGTVTLSGANAPAIEVDQGDSLVVNAAGDTWLRRKLGPTHIPDGSLVPDKMAAATLARMFSDVPAPNRVVSFRDAGVAGGVELLGVDTDTGETIIRGGVAINEPIDMVREAFREPEDSDDESQARIFANAAGQRIGAENDDGSFDLRLSTLSGAAALALDLELAPLREELSFEDSLDLAVCADRLAGVPPEQHTSAAHSLRIPISTPYPDANGNIYKSYGARMDSASDTSATRIEMQIFDCAARTWGAPFVVFDYEPGGTRRNVFNAALNLDDSTGRLWCMFAVSIAGADPDEAQDKDNCLFMMYTDNPEDGASAVWKGEGGVNVDNDAANCYNLSGLFADVMQTGERIYPSPNRGILTSAGHLVWVVQYNPNADSEATWKIAIVRYDRDNDEFVRGALTEQYFHNNECAIAEGADGNLIVYSRQHNVTTGTWTAEFAPLGEECMNHRLRADIYNGRVQMSLLRTGMGDTRKMDCLLLGGLDSASILSAEQRKDLGFSLSYDGGRTWTPRKKIFETYQVEGVAVDFWGNTLAGGPITRLNKTQYNQVSEIEPGVFLATFEHNPVTADGAQEIYTALASVIFNKRTILLS